MLKASLMFALVLVLAVQKPAGSLAAEAGAVAVSETDRTAIHAVITRQLEAFRVDDGETAFAQAAPKIRSIFQTVGNFMAMVRGGYPPVYRSRDYDFRGIEVINGTIVQKVLVVGADGAVVLAIYEMERQADGRWLINGCVLVEAQEEAV
ncbi:DUF4864 domain-containing protein [Oceanibacterium hippocampi]|uniref:DUF4864 domain-containing protein n=1 Tax=Oceanibacterium hippocampi TaxID=745714 RepID=A0A1Y5T1N7_9PROT|nr:DUF4864 domain-containing protein [Oceanibacterium hippocampi]SLN50082.1 hypothetical protein OCH7691_02199 [Oceanibacterium hippocampi]